MPKSESTFVPADARPSPTATTPMLCRMLLRKFTIIVATEDSHNSVGKNRVSLCGVWRSAWIGYRKAFHRSLCHVHVDFTNARRFHDQIDCHDLVGPKRKKENDPWFSTRSPDGSGDTVDERKLCRSRASLERLGDGVVALDLTP